MSTMQTAFPRVRRISRAEYYQMADLGMFQDQRVELIDGEIIEMPAHRDVHVAGILLATESQGRAFGRGFCVRVQVPISIVDTSDPEPDVAIVPGTARDYVGKGHPTTALLVVEISDTTLQYDRGDKASLYARAGIADYWIVNIEDRQLEVLRNPVADPSKRFGYGYADVTLLHEGQTISPLAAPSAVIRVADLLP